MLQILSQMISTRKGSVVTILAHGQECMAQVHLGQGCQHWPKITFKYSFKKVQIFKC